MIIDSALTFKQSTSQNPDALCPKFIIDRLELIDIEYISFDYKNHIGQVVLDKNLKTDVLGFFTLAKDVKFPINKIQPAVTYGWNDELLMSKNISSAFNYRKITGTNYLSNHAKGRAIDINPALNPYIVYDGERENVHPKGAEYDKSIPGVLHSSHVLVLYMKSLGWEWGGDWTKKSGRIDYQHFQKEY